MKEHKSLNRHKYKFTDKSQSVRGIVSTVFAVLAIIVFCVAVFQSWGFAPCFCLELVYILE